jgi:dienelactone hydrolase
MPGLPPLLAAALLLGAGCVGRRPDPVERPTLSPEAPPPGWYRVEGPVPVALGIEVESRTRTREIRRIRIPPRVPPSLAGVPLASEPIEILHYRPAGGGPRPLVLLSPVLANSGLLVRTFAARFAAEGWHAAIVYRKEVEFEAQDPLAHAEDEMRLVVMRSLQALEWLQANESVDPERLATFGVSAGAVVSAVLAGSGPPFRANLVFLGGGPLADLVTESEERRVLEMGRKVERATGLSREVVRERLRVVFRSDPILLAPRVPTESVLMVIARRDRCVPAHLQRRLWDALGRPRMVETPLGHYTTFALLPWLEALAAGFLRERFAQPPPG